MFFTPECYMLVSRVYKLMLVLKARKHFQAGSSKGMKNSPISPYQLPVDDTKE